MRFWERLVKFDKLLASVVLIFIIINTPNYALLLQIWYQALFITKGKSNGASGYRLTIKYLGVLTS